MWDYYHAIDEKLIPACEDIPAVDITSGEAIDGVSVEKQEEGADIMDEMSYSYPRLDELYKRSIKAQAVPDVAAASAAAADAKKGGAKKDPKKPTPTEDEGAAKESVYMKEMKEALKIEKSILRFRLTQVRNWALKRLKLQRHESLNVYKKLEDWITVSSKAENDAIEDVCDIIKDAIEGQTKMQDELRLNFMDFFVDKSYKNYIDPPPPMLDTMEEVRSNRFNVPQLKAIIGELAQVADEKNQIANRAAVELLVKKVRNSRSLGDLGGMPKDWSEFTQNNFELMLRNLDIYNAGQVDYRVLALCFILL